jgi:hypothetical protein
VSNRKKVKNSGERMRKLVRQGALKKIDVPRDEQVVVARVPAKIDWAKVGNITRDDVEIIGETIVYEDNTFDVIVKDDISDEARTLVYGQDLFQFSIAEEGDKEE